MVVIILKLDLLNAVHALHLFFELFRCVHGDSCHQYLFRIICNKLLVHKSKTSARFRVGRQIGAYIIVDAHERNTNRAQDKYYSENQIKSTAFVNYKRRYFKHYLILFFNRFFTVCLTHFLPL